MEKDKLPSTVPRDPQRDSKDKPPEGSAEKSKDHKSHYNKRSKEDEILHKLSKLSTQVAASDEFIQKLFALPEIVAKQAERIESLSAARTDGYWDYEPYEQYDYEEDCYDGQEHTDLNVLQSPKDMFASLLNAQVPETEPISMTPSTGEDQQSNLEDSSTLDILLKNAPPNAFGAPLEEAVAKTFRSLLDQDHDKKTWDKLKENHKVPDNCRRFAPPRVNKEIWANLDKNAMSADWEVKGLQEIVGVVLTSLAKVVQYVNTNSSLMKGATAKDFMDTISESTSAAVYLFQETNLKRRAIVKKSLPRDVAAVITSDMKTTELLFGDNFAELLKTAKAAINLTRPYRGRGGHRMQPYPYRGAKARGGGAPHSYNGGHDNNNLNYHRPPHFNRGARGDRGRGFQSNFNKYSNPTQQNQNQL